MTSREARQLLDINTLLIARGKARIFGNCDTEMRALSMHELIDATMVIYFDNLKPLFEKEDTFFAHLKRKSGLP